MRPRSVKRLLRGFSSGREGSQTRVPLVRVEALVFGLGLMFSLREWLAQPILLAFPVAQLT